MQQSSSSTPTILISNPKPKQKQPQSPQPQPHTHNQTQKLKQKYQTRSISPNQTSHRMKSTSPHHHGLLHQLQVYNQQQLYVQRCLKDNGLFGGGGDGGKGNSVSCWDSAKSVTSTNSFSSKVPHTCNINHNPNPITHNHTPPKSQEHKSITPNKKNPSQPSSHTKQGQSPPKKAQQHNQKFLRANFSIIIEAIANRIKLVREQDMAIQGQYERIRGEIASVCPSDIKIQDYYAGSNGVNDYQTLRKMVKAALSNPNFDYSMHNSSSIQTSAFHQANSQLQNKIHQKMHQIQQIDQSIKTSQIGQQHLILDLQATEQQLKSILKSKGPIEEAQRKERDKKNKMNQIKYVREVVCQFRRDKVAKIGEVVDCLGALYRLRMDRWGDLGKQYQFGNNCGIQAVQPVLKLFISNIQTLQNQKNKQIQQINSQRQMKNDDSKLTIVQALTKLQQDSSIKKQILQNLNLNIGQFQQSSRTHRAMHINSQQNISNIYTPRTNIKDFQSASKGVSQFNNTDRKDSSSKKQNRNGNIIINGNIMGNHNMYATNNNKLQAKKFKNILHCQNLHQTMNKMNTNSSFSSIHVKDGDQNMNHPHLMSNFNMEGILELKPINCENLELRNIVQQVIFYLFQYQDILLCMQRVKELEHIYFLKKRDKLEHQCKIRAMQKYYLNGIIGINQYDTMGLGKSNAPNFAHNISMSNLHNLNATQHSQSCSIQPVRYNQLIGQTIKKCQIFIQQSTQKSLQRSTLLHKIKNVQQSIQLLNTQIQIITTQPLRKQQVLSQVQLIIENQKKIMNNKLSVVRELAQECERLRNRKVEIESELEDCADRGDLAAYKDLSVALGQVEDGIRQVEIKMEGHNGLDNRNNSMNCSSGFKNMGHIESNQILNKIKQVAEKNSIQIEIDKIKFKNLGELLSKVTRRLQVI